MPNEMPARGILNAKLFECRGFERERERETLVSLRVRITGNDIPAILTKLTAGRDFLSRFARIQGRCSTSRRRRRGSRQSSGFDSQGCEKEWRLSPSSPCDLDRESTSSTFLPCLSEPRERERKKENTRVL